ncbi:MAG: prepilin-type N-terminal cleavage/methylation domain-containing protein [Chloroflexi bacterium]|nr:prepilin-type N-terminal cleavage/methylation domain-containing protein [Chloroflexota bacterium]
MKKLLRRHRSFTLIELIVVIAIIGILAAIAVPAVSGTIGLAKVSNRDGDLKSVVQANERFNSDSGFDAVPGSPATTVEDTDGDGIIVVVIDTTATDKDEVPASPDVTCGSPNSTLADALAQCFRSINFSLLVPDTISTEPGHSDERVVVTSADDSSADLSVSKVNRFGETLELYTDTDITTADGLAVWSFSGVVLLLIGEADY